MIMEISWMGRLRPLGVVAIGFAMGLCAACSGTASRSSTAGLASDCIINRGVRDFDVLDEQNLILYGPGNTAYHVVMATPSTFIRGEIAIGIEDADGRICPYGGDAILVNGPLTERIPIRAIQGLDAADVEALKVEYGLIEAAGDAVTVTEIE
jgi:hypothetical protein